MTNWTSTNAYTARSAEKLTNSKGYIFKVSWYGGDYYLLIVNPDGKLDSDYEGLASWDLARILNDWQVEAR